MAASSSETDRQPSVKDSDDGFRIHANVKEGPDEAINKLPYAYVAYSSASCSSTGRKGIQEIRSRGKHVSLNPLFLETHTG